MEELRVCSQTLADAARRLAANSAAAPEYPLGLARRRDGLVWLAGPPPSPARPPEAGTDRLRVCAETAAERHLAAPDRPGICLLLGRDARAGHLTALRLTAAGDRFPLSGISQVGPGMARLLQPQASRLQLPVSFPLQPSALRMPRLVQPQASRLQPPVSVPPHPSSFQTPSPFEIWSRTIGALGPEAWSRLTDLRFAVSGCGRLGSALAELLARMGVHALTLIDSDRLESHNLGETVGARPSDTGRLKTEVLAEFLAVHAPGCRLESVPYSLLRLPALAAVGRGDLLISAPDDPGARLAAGFLAAAYLLPLLDVGTGVFHEGPAALGRRLGADVRLVLPGRCLLCSGGIANPGRAAAALLGRGEAGATGAGGFPGGRSGSLASLNTIAAGLAVRLAEDLVLSRVTESVWLRLEFDDDGIPTLERRALPPAPGCPLCALTGRGDAALAGFPALLARMGTPP